MGIGLKNHNKNQKRKQTLQMKDGAYTQNLNDELERWKEVLRRHFYMPEGEKPKNNIHHTWPYMAKNYNT